MRRGHIERKTAETSITVTIDLDGSGRAEVSSGVGFFDHMLTAVAKHGLFDLTVECRGDLDVDAHHSVEDIGICIGQALAQALDDKQGIARYGAQYVPMDEALAFAAVDISGRPYLVFDMPPLTPMVGGFDTELTVEFMRALAFNAGITLHLAVRYGQNSHHMLEAAFKALARALRQAAALDARVSGVLSTKGVL